MITSIACNDKLIVPGYMTDIFKTADGKDLKITFIKHASLLLEFDGHYIYTDPVSDYADFTKMPKADLILITHEHHDHLDPKAINNIKKDTTKIVINQSSYNILHEGIVINNGEMTSPYPWIDVQAVPAYNTTPAHLMYHPRNRDNGYIITIGDSRIYFSGDTEDIPEMKIYKDIDIAFISVNQPYTMTPQQAIHAINMIHPKIIYPYYYGDTDLSLLNNNIDIPKDIDVRIRLLP